MYMYLGIYITLTIISFCNSSRATIIYNTKRQWIVSFNFGIYAKDELISHADQDKFYECLVAKV